MHGAVWISDEDRVNGLCLARFFICLLCLVCRVYVLFFTDIEVVVDEQLAEGNILLKLFAAELVRDHASVAIVDDILIVRVAKRKMINLVREVDSPATLH